MAPRVASWIVNARFDQWGAPLVSVALSNQLISSAMEPFDLFKFNLASLSRVMMRDMEADDMIILLAQNSLNYQTEKGRRRI